MPGWDETKNQHRLRLREPSDFQAGTLRTIELAPGVQAIVGKLTSALAVKLRRKGMVLQSVHFSKTKWSMAKAKQWLRGRTFTDIPDTEAMMAITDIPEMVLANDDVDTEAPLAEVPAPDSDEEPVPPAEELVTEMADSMEDRHAAQEERAKKYGIAALKNGALTPPAGFPKNPDAYADPTNFAYPVHDAAHANNARVRFRQQEGGPYSDADSARVYNRIVTAQLKFGAKPSFDPNDSLDKMLSPELKAKLKKPWQGGEEQQDHAESAESAALMRMLYKLLAQVELDPKDREFLMACAAVCGKGKMPSREEVLRVRGIADTLHYGWPDVVKPLGLEPSVDGAVWAPKPQNSYPAAYVAIGDRCAFVPFRADVGNAETFNIPNVEIFAVGTWHGEPWTEQDLDEIVHNFGALYTQVRPPLKLGHHNGIQATPGQEPDSAPAFGWVGALRKAQGKSGPVLVADFTHVPRVVRDLIQQRAYSRVSSEIYLGYTDGNKGTQYGKVLRAVALLGSAMPEVKTLQDITLLYRDEERPLASSSGQRIWVEYCEQATTTGGTEVPTEIKTDELAELKAKLAASEKRSADAEALLKKMDRDRLTTEINAFFTEMVGKGVFVPAQELPVKAFLGALTADQVRVFSADGKTPFDMAKELFSTLRPQVQMSEQIPTTTVPQPGQTPGAPEPRPREQKPEVVTFTDGLDRTYEVGGIDVVQKVREMRAQDPKLSFEDAVARIERQKKGSGTTWLI